jgi:hypothetical protein
VRYFGCYIQEDFEALFGFGRGKALWKIIDFYNRHGREPKESVALVPLTYSP